MAIYVIGSFNKDVFLDVERYPHPGETITGHLRTGAGGKGFNQAIAAARAGAKVSFIGAVGEDDGLTLLQKTAEAESIDLSLLQISKKKTPTGTAIILVNKEGENVIIIEEGANGEVSLSQMDSISLNENDLLVAQLEIPQATIVEAFQKAKTEKATTVLNAAPLGKPLDTKLLGLTDILLVNETGCAALGSIKGELTEEAIHQTAQKLLTGNRHFGRCRPYIL